MDRFKTPQWISQLNSRVIKISLIITMGLVLTKAYHNYSRLLLIQPPQASQKWLH